MQQRNSVRACQGQPPVGNRYGSGGGMGADNGGQSAALQSLPVVQPDGLIEVDRYIQSHVHQRRDQFHSGHDFRVTDRPKRLSPPELFDQRMCEVTKVHLELFPDMISSFSWSSK